MRKLIFALSILLLGTSLPSCDLTDGDDVAPEHSEKPLDTKTETEGEEDVTGQSGNDR